MICRPCAIGADIATGWRSASEESFLVNVFDVAVVQEGAERAHAECAGIGCTCQHRINMERPQRAGVA